MSRFEVKLVQNHPKIIVQRSEGFFLREGVFKMDAHLYTSLISVNKSCRANKAIQIIFALNPRRVKVFFEGWRLKNSDGNNLDSFPRPRILSTPLSSPSFFHIIANSCSWKILFPPYRSFSSDTLGRTTPEVLQRSLSFASFLHPLHRLYAFCPEKGNEGSACSVPEVLRVR